MTSRLEHCSDQQLLEYLDSELSTRAERRVKEHLGCCWRCRARLTLIEERVRAVAELVESDVFPGPAQIADASSRISARISSYESGLRPSPTFRVLVDRRPLPLWLAGTCVFVFLVGALALSLEKFALREPGAPNLETVVAGATNYESGLVKAGLPVHQVLRIEFQETVLTSRKHSGHLEVWSDPADGRFATRWIRSDGTLQFGAWRPAPDQQYLYDPRLSTALAVKRTSEAASREWLDPRELDPEDLAGGFLGWLASRPWHPISFSRNLAVFIGKQGVTARLEQGIGKTGNALVRISAEREIGNYKVTFEMEMDRYTYRPLSQTLRYGRAGHVVELHLINERTETIPAEDILPAVFEPDPTLVRLPQQAEMKRSREQVSDSQSQEKPPAELLNSSDSAAIETQARYILHQLGVCLGEPVTVSKDQTGRIQVRGLVRTAERKAELLAALSKLRGGLFTEPHLRTVDELLAERATSTDQIGNVDLSEEHTPSRWEPTPYRASRKPVLLVEKELENFFRQRPLANSRDMPTATPSPEDVKKNIIRLTNEAISTSESLLDQAWALRRLAEHYGPERSLLLPSQSRRLLEVMIKDHLAALKGESKKTRDLLEPVLSWMLNTLNTEGFDDKRSVPAQLSRDDRATWTSLSLQVFRTGATIDDLIHRLLSVSEPAASSRNDRERRLALKQELLASLQQLDTEIPSLEQRVEETFRISSVPRSSGALLEATR